jgi:hypothetical protein
MVNHKRFTCEECGNFWKIKSRVIYGKQILCIRCYKKFSSAKYISKMNREANREWRATHRRKAYSPTEQKVLYWQYKKEGLNDQEIQDRLCQLKNKVLESNKKVLEIQNKEPKKTFKENFEEMINK